jgi:hypothetical protein
MLAGRESPPQAQALDDPWVVARNESGPRYVRHHHAEALLLKGFAFSKASTTASDTVAEISIRRPTLS